MNEEGYDGRRYQPRTSCAILLAAVVASWVMVIAALYLLVVVVLEIAHQLTVPR